MGSEAIILKTPEEIAIMRRAGLVVARVLEALKETARPGLTTLALERLAEEEIRRGGATPAFKGYRDYPFCLCTSLNNEVVHGMPSGRALKDGDILSIDVGVLLDGFYADAAITLPIGNVSSEALRLINVTRESLDKAIDAARSGARLMDISSAVQRHVEAEGFSVVREFVGHGIGIRLHEAPQVPNFGSPGMGARLKPGMVLAIEPMINAGAYDVKVLKDGWTAVTVDGSLSAHFEHTVAITENGPYVLTRP